MKTNTRYKILSALVIWVVTSVLVGVGVQRYWLGEIEDRTWDWRVRSVAKASDHDPKIVLVMIDQTSLEHFAREEKIFWPWPRSLYNPLLFFLKKAGAKAVAFDMLFTESSTYVADDKEFADAVSGSLPVVSAVAFRTTGEPVRDAGYMKLYSRQEQSAEKIAPYILPGTSSEFVSAALPIDELLQSSAAFGNVSSQADDDQIFRRVHPAGYLRATPVLSLPFAMHSLLNSSEGLRSYLSEVSLPDGALLLRFHGPAGTYKTFSFHAITSSWVAMEAGESPAVPLEEFKDAYVLVGANAPGLLDLRSVPFPGNYPGVEYHATALDNLMHRAFFRDVPQYIVTAISVVALALVIASGLFLPVWNVAVAIGEVLLWIGACVGAAHLGWWMTMVIPFIGMGVAVLATAVVQYQVEGRRHRFIRNAFQYYISSEVIEKLVSDPSTLRLGGERRELTIFFSDIQGFTGISERLPADRLVQFLNRFLSEMSSIVLEYGGTLDKYQGDAVIAFWNAPVEVADHQRQAIGAALRCQERLRELAPEFEREFGIQVRMRIGIHTGVVSVGNFGSSKRFNYTMIGDAANVASRLEGVNKVFGTTIIASDVTREPISGDFKWRKLGSVRVVGRKEPIVVYHPVGIVADYRSDEVLSAHERALGMFERGELPEARAAFEKLGDDSVAKAYVARIDKVSRDDKSFDAVWELSEK